MQGAGFETEEYTPGRSLTVVFIVLTVGLLGFGFYVSTLYEWREIEGEYFWLWIAALPILFLAGPRVLQYVLLRVLGVSELRWKWFDSIGKSGLKSWWETRDEVLPRSWFALVYSLPSLLACSILVAYVVRFPMTAPVIFCLLPLYAINLWYTLLALGKPAGTRVEPFERGVRFHQPI